MAIILDGAKHTTEQIGWPTFCVVNFFDHLPRWRIPLKMVPAECSNPVSQNNTGRNPFQLQQQWPPSKMAREQDLLHTTQSNIRLDALPSGKLFSTTQREFPNENTGAKLFERPRNE